MGVKKLGLTLEPNRLTEPLTIRTPPSVHSRLGLTCSPPPPSKGLAALISWEPFNVAHPLLDHLVGSGQQRFRDGEAERPSGLEVDDEIELGDLSQPSWRCARFV